LIARIGKELQEAVKEEFNEPRPLLTFGKESSEFDAKESSVDSASIPAAMSGSKEDPLMAEEPSKTATHLGENPSIGN